MATVDFSSGTSALTNALKQVFYIHKDVVADLKGKIDSLTKENDLLKQKLQSSDVLVGQCQACKELEDLNKSLQEGFERQLKDKDAIIYHLEEKLEKTFSRNASEHCSKYEKAGRSNEGERSPRVKRCDTNLDECLSPDRDKNSASITSPVNSPTSNINGTGSKLSSRLKLPKEGHKRRRYVEQENIPDSKRQKVSPTSSKSKNDKVESQQEGVDLGAGLRMSGRLTRKKSAEYQDNKVLVAETENFTCLDETIKNKHPVLSEQGMKDITNAKSQKFLSIPETLVVDEFSQEYDSDDEDLSSRIENPKLVGSIQESTSSVNTDKHFSDSMKCHRGIENRGQRDESKLKENSKVVNVVMKSEKGGDISMTSPISPGIFDDLVRPLSNSDTPKSSKATESDVGKRFISCSAKPVREVEKFLRSKPAEDNLYKRGLLRQTTLSQTFSNNNNSSYTKQGGRKSKSLRSKSEYDREDEEEAILRKVMEQSLMEANLNDGLASSKNTTHGNRSPFKVPLPTARSPRSKVKKGLASLKSSNTDERSADDGKIRRHGNEGCMSDSSNEDVTDLSVSSPDRIGRNVSSLGLRRSPRLSSSSSPRQDMKSHGESGDLAKRALFLDSKKKMLSQSSTNSYPKSEGIGHGESGSEGEEEEREGVGVMNTVGTLGMNGSVDPIMHLSMFLDSGAPASLTATSCSDKGSPSVKKRAGLHTAPSSLSHSLLPPPSLQTGGQDDMDETVAPNAFSFGVSTSMGDQPKEDTGIAQDEDEVEKEYDSANQDDNEETIAPSPQQQSARPFHSQTLSGFPSTCQSFKFVTSVRNGGPTSSKTRAKVTHVRHSEDQAAVCIDVDKEGSGNCSHEPEICDFDNTISTKMKGGKRAPVPPPVQSLSTLCDSFDVVPKKSPEFPHVQVVRKKADRDKLQGFSCHQCAQYYKDMNLSDAELQQRMRACSRHKQKYRAPDTPEHFWSLSIRDTAEDQVDMKEKQPEVVRLRRRKRLEMRQGAETEGMIE